MNTRELMMGNLIQIEGNPVEVIKIFEIHLEVHSSIFQFWSVEIEEVEPIPLTEEWLIRMGFTKKEDHFLFDIDSRTIQVSGVDNDPVIPHLWIKDTFSTYHHEYSFLMHPKYVHQLQNLFFCLNGHELTIKES